LRETSIDKLLIGLDHDLMQALRRMDQGSEKILVVVDRSSCLKGVLTDGDIRRHILKKGSINGIVQDCYNPNPIFIMQGDSLEKAKGIMISRRIDAIPMVDSKKRVVELVTWNFLFQKKQKNKKKLSCPLVVMAGGKGNRLVPFTHILPKALIPIGEKPIIEMILQKFYEYAVDHFYIVVNFKGEMIKSYFDNAQLAYQISYIWEKEFLGTAGSLRLLPKKFPETFIVSNCDVIVQANYPDLIDYHHKNGNVLTILGSLQHHVLPYGVIEFTSHGIIQALKEKPSYDVTINTGVYVLDKSILRYIPKGFFHMTDLINILLREKRNVGVYPVSEKSYADIGQWEEYKKNVSLLMKKGDHV